MKYALLIVFVLMLVVGGFLAFTAEAGDDFQVMLNKFKEDGCITYTEVKTLELALNSKGIRKLNSHEVSRGSKLLFDLNGPNDDFDVYASFYGSTTRIIGIKSDGCFIGYRDIPSNIAAMFLDKMAVD